MATHAGQRRSDSCYIGDVHLAATRSGALNGLTAVVKDCFDVAGHRTSNGSPAWLETHPPAKHNAAAVQVGLVPAEYAQPTTNCGCCSAGVQCLDAPQALLDAGATITGKNVMDEMAYSLAGENKHYGTPVNPAAPGRIPGGSSSGTAAAVAAGDADLGLGEATKHVASLFQKQTCRCCSAPGTHTLHHQPVAQPAPAA